MKKKEEREYLDKRWKKMQQYFKTFIRKQDLEALHQFRVQVKKIRSLLTLLAQNDKNTALLKTFNPVRKVFKSGGVVRDVALHEQQAKAAGINWEPLAAEQHQQQKKAVGKLVSKGEKQLQKMKDVKRELQQQIYALSALQINTFYEKQLLDTQQLLEQHNFSEALHNARKMLKHLLYNKNIFRKNITAAQTISFAYIDELQCLIGDWHDNKLALGFFTPRLDNKDLTTLQSRNAELEKAIDKKGKDFKISVQNTNPPEEESYHKS